MLLHLLQFRRNLDLQVFYLLYEVRIALFEGLDIMRSMRTVNDALGANWVASTCEAIIAYKLISMRITDGLILNSN